MNSSACTTCSFATIAVPPAHAAAPTLPETDWATIVSLYGRLMEIGPAEQVFASPQHPYTKALLSAVPLSSVVPAVAPLNSWVLLSAPDFTGAWM